MQHPTSLSQRNDVKFFSPFSYEAKSLLFNEGRFCAEPAGDCSFFAQVIVFGLWSKVSSGISV